MPAVVIMFVHFVIVLCVCILYHSYWCIYSFDCPPVLAELLKMTKP